jgi:DNA-binding XRE family transcriptional regulator
MPFEIDSRSVRYLTVEIPTVQVVRGLECAVDGATGSSWKTYRLQGSPFGHFSLIRNALACFAFSQSNSMSKQKTKVVSEKPLLPKLAYTREEAAQVLGIHPITISRLTEKGQLRPSRATRRPLYSDEELKRFLRDTASAPKLVNK